MFRIKMAISVVDMVNQVTCRTLKNVRLGVLNATSAVFGDISQYSATLVENVSIQRVTTLGRAGGSVVAEVQGNNPRKSRVVQFRVNFIAEEQLEPSKQLEA